MHDANQGPKRLIIGSAGKDAQAAEDIGRVIQIQEANGEPWEGVKFTVVGTLSDRYRKTQARQRDRWAKKSNKKESGDDIEAQSLELTASAVIAWEGVCDSDGSPVPCNREAVMQVLRECPWIREQVNAEIQDHSAFFTSSSRS